MTKSELEFEVTPFTSITKNLVQPMNLSSPFMTPMLLSPSVIQTMRALSRAIAQIDHMTYIFHFYTPQQVHYDVIQILTMSTLLM